MFSVWDLFTDPLFRGPTLGCMLVSLVASLVGVLVFVRRRALLGEALSHGTYPGLIGGVLLAAALGEGWLNGAVLTGSFLSALAALWLIDRMEKRLRVRQDVALCFVLAGSFGVGLTLVSQVQFAYPALYRQAQGYLFGQAPTMTDLHIGLYGLLAAAVVVVILLFYKEFQACSFDEKFAESLGINTRLVQGITLLLIVTAVVTGIRSLGVVLMSAMLIAPATAARQYTQRMHLMLLLAGFFGSLSGLLGSYLSLLFALPTGPAIVLVASAISLFALLFSPRRGLLLRGYRILSFRFTCAQENVLKGIWRSVGEGKISRREVARLFGGGPISAFLMLWRLERHGWIENGKLTRDGQHRALRIIRLHRLWEVYLVSYLGVGVERVHRNAEEMEHIITPELEKELVDLLNDPTEDPHSQPIPPKAVTR